MVALEVSQLTKSFCPGEPALRQMSLAAQAGEILAIVGPSGSGKTTLLRLIAGLERPDSGEVRLGGQPANDLPPWRRGVGLVFQEGGLPGDWTARHCLEFAGRGIPQAGQRVAEVAQAIGLEAQLSARVATLSGGQRRRVALARALVRQPQVLLLDEPLASLDPFARAQLRREIARAAPATAVLVVTHDPLDALTLGGRIAVLDRGELLQIGAAREVYERPVSRTVAALLRPLGLSAFSGAALRLPWTGGGEDWLRHVENPREELLAPVGDLVACQPGAAERVHGGLTLTTQVSVTQVTPWEGRLLVRGQFAGPPAEPFTFCAPEGLGLGCGAQVITLSVARWFWCERASGRVVAAGLGCAPAKEFS